MYLGCPDCGHENYGETKYVWNTFLIRCEACGTIFNDSGEIYYTVGDEDDDWLKLYNQTK